MRRLCFTLCMLVALFLPGALHAQLFFLDSYTDNTAPFQSPGGSSPIFTALTLVDRSLSGSSSGSASTLTTQINNGWTTTGTAATGSSYSATALYQAYSALNLSTAPYLQLQIVNVIGTPSLNIQLLTEDLHSLNYSGTLNSSLSGQSLTLDVRQMAGYNNGDLTDLRIFSLGLTGSNAGSSVTISQFSFADTPSLAAIPEPSSYVLAIIAVSVLLAAAYHHRKQIS